jgi:homoserine O-acetyltransferase
VDAAGKFPDRPGVEAAKAHRFGVDFQIESYLAHQGDKFVERYDANSYLYISKAMDLFDLGDGAASFEEGVGRIRARALIVGVPTDLLFPIALQKELADALAARGHEATFRVLESIYGHDSFLVEVEPLTAILKEFLAAV